MPTSGLLDLYRRSIIGIGGGGAAPSDAQYVTLAINADLSDERVLTAGSGISIIDGGAGSTLTIKVMHTVVVKTTVYGIASTDDVIVCNSTTAFAVTLPAASGSGKQYIIKSINIGSITITPDGADTIDGQPNIILGQWDSVILVDYAANKWIIV